MWGGGGSGERHFLFFSFSLSFSHTFSSAFLPLCLSFTLKFPLLFPVFCLFVFSQLHYTLTLFKGKCERTRKLLQKTKQNVLYKNGCSDALGSTIKEKSD